MRNLLLSLMTMMFLISCGEDDIPTSDNSKQVDWKIIKQTSSIQENAKVESDNYKNDSDDEISTLDEEDREEIEIDPIPNASESEQFSKDDYSEYNKKMESEIKNAWVNYSRPPIPANLSPYDTREESSYRATTEAESKGSGAFPPMPPAMYVDTN